MSGRAFSRFSRLRSRLVMTPGAAVTRSVMALAVVAAISLTVRAQDQELLYRVREAKEAGWKEITINIAPYHSNGTLEERAARSAVLLLELRRPDVARVFAPPGMYRWHAFRVERVLSAQTKPKDDRCQADLSTVPDGDLAVEFFGGSTVIDGVSVIFSNGWSFDPAASSSKKYLAFVRYCSPRGALLLDGASGWFPVDAAGAVGPSGSTVAAAKEVEAMGSISAVEQWLRAKKGKK